MKTCKDCDYYEGIGEGKNGKGEPTAVGNCFRYPPANGPNGSAYPIVGSKERECGEFKVKRKASR